MLSKVCASWLVVLVLLPFTAPFPTFDLSDLQPKPSRHLGVPHSKTPVAALSHVALSRAAPFPARAASRLRLSLSRLRSPHAAALACIEHAAAAGPAPMYPAHPASRPIVLRI